MNVLRRPYRIWVLFLAGPVIWYLHFWAVYLLAEAVCASGGFESRLLGLRPLSFVTVVATVVAAGAITWFGWRAYRLWRDNAGQATGDHPIEGEAADRRDSERALALGGFLLAVTFFVSVLFVGLPALFLQSC